MATSALPARRVRSQLQIWHWLALFLSAIFLASVGAMAWGYFLAHSALPQLDGTVQVHGLSAPVTVTRDAHGVPTIEASNLQDLFFAQGYVTAQDRLWQMDTMRRFAAGQLSEILGEGFAEHDREQRILGLRQAAQKSLDSIVPQDRVFLDAYARGVNAYIDSHGDK